MAIEWISNKTFWGGVIVGLLPAMLIIVMSLALHEEESDGY